MTTDEKSGEAASKWRHVPNVLLAICVGFGALCGLVLFSIGQALAGIGGGLAGSRGSSGLSLNDLIELTVLSGGGALIGSLPGFALRHWARKIQRARQP